MANKWLKQNLKNQDNLQDFDEIDYPVNTLAKM